MQIVLIHRNIFENRPPIISLVTLMYNCNVKPILITAGINDYYKNQLEKVGVYYYIIPFTLKKGKFSAIFNYVNSIFWGKQVQKLLGNLKLKNPIYWIEGNYTFTALNKNFLLSNNFILQCQEMFDVPGIKGRLYTNVLHKLAKSALCIIVPEYNRAHLFRLHFNLERLPYILPNKPSFIPSKIELKVLENKYSQYEYLFSKKIILYQGIISKERSDLYPILNAFLEINKNNTYRFLMLGPDPDNLTVTLLSQGYELTHIPFIPAPDYLYFTSRAYIGVVTYRANSLNNIYCAPNKIFEYAAFSIPMIGNNLPGLLFTIGTSGCGRIYNDSSNIAHEFEYIINNHANMSVKAKLFFESVDNKNTITEILRQISHKTELGK